jgi:hypothetical protein
MAAVDWNDPQTLNRYAYVGGEPVNYRDPSGTDGKAALANPWALLTLPIDIIGILTDGVPKPVFHGTLTPRPTTVNLGCESIDALNANNGIGNAAPSLQPSGSESNGTGVTFYNNTTRGPQAMNPGAEPESGDLSPLAAPGIFVLNSYNNCMARYGYAGN